MRGWYRQNDFPQNELLYDEALGGPAYRAWLRGLGVRYVVITDAPPDYSARGEARLIRSGRSGLVPVFRSLHVMVYELPDASPIVTGRSDASIRWMWPTRIVFSVAEPGRYRVKVRWSPYWHTSQGCVWRGKDGTVRVQARNAGLVDLRVNVNVSSRARHAGRPDAAPHVRRRAGLSALASSGHGRGNDLISRGAARRARGPARLGPRVPLTLLHSRRGSPSSKRS